MLSPGSNPPYHILYPFIAMRVHGKLKDIAIFSEQWWGRQVSKLYYPSQPRTSAQQGRFWTFANAMYNWGYFDSVVRNYYNEQVKGKRLYGVNRYIQLFFKANYPMIIYWNTLEKSASDPALIPDYIASPYFTRGLYPAAANKLLSLGPSGDLVLPESLRVLKDLTLGLQSFVSAYGSSTIIASTITSDVVFTTEVTDVLSEFDGTVFTAKKAGVYLVTLGFCCASYDWAAGNFLHIIISKNNSVPDITCWATVVSGAAFTGFMSGTCSALVSLAVGDTLRAKLYHNRGANTALQGNTSNTYFTIAKVA